MATAGRSSPRRLPSPSGLVQSTVWSSPPPSPPSPPSPSPPPAARRRLAADPHVRKSPAAWPPGRLATRPRAMRSATRRDGAIGPRTKTHRPRTGERHGTRPASFVCINKSPMAGMSRSGSRAPAGISARPSSEYSSHAARAWARAERASQRASARARRHHLDRCSSTLHHRAPPGQGYDTVVVLTQDLHHHLLLLHHAHAPRPRTLHRPLHRPLHLPLRHRRGGSPPARARWATLCPTPCRSIDASTHRRIVRRRGPGFRRRRRRRRAAPGARASAVAVAVAPRRFVSCCEKVDTAAPGPRRASHDSRTPVATIIIIIIIIAACSCGPASLRARRLAGPLGSGARARDDVQPDDAARNLTPGPPPVEHTGARASPGGTVVRPGPHVADPGAPAREPALVRSISEPPAHAANGLAPAGTRHDQPSPPGPCRLTLLLARTARTA